ncbi:right-handed parallel beta-helix repeat-containing protein [Wenzhouxiangella sediminis]|nr:right-handed parallel beta-helix repeat-containing protein [Wenzhouxiangella sediminis]
MTAGNPGLPVGTGPKSRRIARFALLLTCLAFGHVPAWSVTYHVRTDGGDERQCNGLFDRPYPGHGNGQACAWKHPFIALPPGGAPRISGGDTLVIGSGDYRMGLGAPGGDNCDRGYSWDCHMPALPSGPDAEHPTRLLGSGFDAGCPAAPILWGTERAAMILNLSGTANAEVACLEITDQSGCIEFHCHGGDCGGKVHACQRDQPPFGPWASTGIFASDASEIELSDVHVHGLAGRGIQAGGISNWRLERVRILANGWAGWDGDIGPDSANAGTILFREVEIGYNGCAESWPELEIGGCWAQTAGGYGDGLGTAETGGDWIFQRVRIHHNTSDGLDLAYLDAASRVAIDASLFEGNAGNQIKIAASAAITNSVIIGNCAHFAGQANFSAGDHCRAGGDAVFLGLGPAVESRLVGNSITGEGNCLVSSAGDAGGRILFASNLLLGQLAHARGRASCQFYSDQPRAEVIWRSNLVVGVHRGICNPASSCVRHAGVRRTQIDDFDPTPLKGSPMLGGGSAGDWLHRDFWGIPRPAEGPHAIGAIGPLGRSQALEALRAELKRQPGHSGPGTNAAGGTRPGSGG